MQPTTSRCQAVEASFKRYEECEADLTIGGKPNLLSYRAGLICDEDRFYDFTKALLKKAQPFDHFVPGIHKIQFVPGIQMHEAVQAKMKEVTAEHAPYYCEVRSVPADRWKDILQDPNLW